MSIEKLKELYWTYIQDCDNPVTLERMCAISKLISEESEIYKHCEYQSMIAGSVVSQRSNFVIATAPTGSGKTWIQAIIAKFYCQNNNEVTIVEPSEHLRDQTKKMLYTVDCDLKVLTMEEFYKSGCDTCVLIINEYDQMLLSHPYFVHNGNLSGMW
jgi:superfamily II DNA or RNA helicase